MCIICNMASDDSEYMGRAIIVAATFIDNFDISRYKMRDTANAMLAVSKIAPREIDRKRYDKIHKEMVRLIRAWNALEQKREH